MPGRGPSSLAADRLPDAPAAGEQWTRLALAGGNVFSTWEWTRAWLDHLGGEEDFAPLAVSRDDGELVAILPLSVARKGPLRVARIAGHGPADQLGPVCAPADRAEVAAVFAAAATELAPVFLAERLERGEGWGSSLGGRLLQSEPSPTLDLRGRDWEGYLADRSSNFRSQVRRAERKLIREHGLSYRLADAATFEADFETLLRLHRARWADDSDSFDGPVEAFHREFAAVALAKGWLRLWVASADGRDVAAWYGLRFGGAESFYQAGRDPAWERSKVGFVLLAQTIRAAFEDGLEEYRFLRGGETYKSRFTDAGTAVETVVASRGPLGGVTAALAERAVGSDRGRRLLARLAG